MTMLHEIGGILFVIVGAFHLKVNWKPLLSYCKQRTGRIALCVGTAVVVLVLVLGFGHEEYHHHRGGGPRTPVELHRR